MRRLGSIHLIWMFLALLIVLPNNISAHTPGIITSNLSPTGPMPANITENSEFFEGDSVYFRMGDGGENITMRVSIDIDGDGVFNQSDMAAGDVFSNWLVFSCEVNEGGNETVEENCSVSFTYQFQENNSSGMYYYQVERRVDENHSNSWINTIFVGVDIHVEGGMPSIGDCFGAGCDEVVENVGAGGWNVDVIKLLILISGVGVIGLSLSIIKERNEKVELLEGE